MARESKQPPAKGKKTVKSGETAKSAGSGKAGAKSRTSRPARGGGAGRTTGRTRNRVRPMLTSRAAILALVVCAIALTLAYPLREYVMQRAQAAQLQEERERMEDNVADLERRVEDLSQDEYVENEARTRLHYQYPGETAYIVVRPDSEPGERDEDEPEEPWFTTLWNSVEEADDPRREG